MIENAIRDAPALVARSALTRAQREEMFALLSEHFENVTGDQFEHDLDEKNWVIEIRRLGRLVGFSTLLVSTVVLEDEPITAIFSGDTIVASEARGTPVLSRAWIKAVNRFRNDCPTLPCYWLLLTSGFRTYRFLPVFWRDFFPRHDTAIPTSMSRRLRQLARERYGASFDPTAGIVRFAQPQRLRPGFADVPASRIADPHVAFFLERNPGHARGDELVCLTEISDANLTAAGRRMLAEPAR